MNNREVGGVVLGFAGFVALTLAFKGTWANVWEALLGRPTPGEAKAQGGSSTAATRVPGAAPAPLSSPVLPKGPVP